MNEVFSSQEPMGTSPVEAGRAFLTDRQPHEISPMARKLAGLFDSPDGQMALVGMLRAAAERPDYREQMKEGD